MSSTPCVRAHVRVAAMRCAAQLRASVSAAQHLGSRLCRPLDKLLNLGHAFLRGGHRLLRDLDLRLGGLDRGLVLRLDRSFENLAQRESTCGRQSGRRGRLAGQGRQGAGSGRGLPVDHAGPSGTWGRVRTWVAVFSFVFWLRRLLVACFKTLLPPATAFAAAAFTAVTVILISAFLNFSTAFFAKVLDLALTFKSRTPVIHPAPSRAVPSSGHTYARAQRHNAVRPAALRRGGQSLGWDGIGVPAPVSQHSAHALTRYVSTHASTRRV
jgi:hypothetical protein